MTSIAHSLRYMLAILTASLVTPSVQAHTHLAHQYPAVNTQMIVAPQAITLNSSEDVETGFSDAKITELEDEDIKTLSAEWNEQDQKRLIVPLTDSPEPGAYTVDWHIVPVDGHRTKGHYTFSVE